MQDRQGWPAAEGQGEGEEMTQHKDNLMVWLDFLERGDWRTGSHPLFDCVDKLTELTGIDIEGVPSRESLHADYQRRNRGMTESAIARMVSGWQEINIHELLLGLVKPPGRCWLTLKSKSTDTAEEKLWEVHLYEIPEHLEHSLRGTGLWPGVQ
jgi:hypothetical protein